MRLIRGTPVHRINLRAPINHAIFPNRGRLAVEGIV
jgi:hypothetical protein